MATEEQKNNIIDGMIDGSMNNPDSLAQWHRKIGGAIGNSIEIKVYLADLTPAAQNAVRAAYKYWENISGIIFREITDEDDADITFGFKDFASDPYYKPEWYGASTLAPSAQNLSQDPDYQATIMFNTLKGVSNFENAQNDPRYWRVLVHEIGHALGLEHPFEVRDADTAPEADNSLYSIMAKEYPEGIPVGTGDTARLPNETPMAYDILAIQNLYGTNTLYDPTDYYTWTAGNHYLAIWDTGYKGGTDTVDVSNQSGKATINLSEFDNGGGEIKIRQDDGKVRFYVGIAFGTTIENATGTNQDDSITGNDQANILKGYGGNDTLVGGFGQDTLDGGAGNDVFQVEGTDTAYDKFIGGAGTDKILGSSGDDVIRVHELLASDSIEVIDGGGGVNRIEGTDQADTIDLSASTVSNISGVYGGIGNDTLIGTRGQDYLYGGAGKLPCFFGRQGSF